MNLNHKVNAPPPRNKVCGDIGEGLETLGGRIQMEEVDPWSVVLGGIDLDPFLPAPPPDFLYARGIYTMCPC